jgi:hypothetical protein
MDQVHPGFLFVCLLLDGRTPNPVGASMLAMVVNDDTGCLNARVVWTFFASKLAPTGGCVRSS